MVTSSGKLNATGQNSARGHELSGRVCAHAYNYYALAECAWVAKFKLLITPLRSEAIIIFCIILQVWFSLKSVTTTPGLLFSWLHNYTALHSSYHIGEPSLIPKLPLPCVYDTMIMQFYY